MYICIVENISMKKPKSKQTGQRQIKIYPKHFERSFRDVVFPEIRLCGKWLLDMGFKCGEMVLIKHKRNKIIIEVSSNNKPTQ